MPLHASPLDAVAEIDSLYDVYEDVRQKWDMEVSPPHTLWMGLWGPCSVPGPTGCVSW